MRSLRQRRHRYAPNSIPVVDDGYGCLPDPKNRDYLIQQEQERMIATANDVADFAIYYAQAAPKVGNALKMQLYTAAIRRFEHRLSAWEIRDLVDCAIAKDAYDRDRSVRFRRAEARRKAEDGARRRSVLSSPAQIGST